MSISKAGLQVAISEDEFVIKYEITRTLQEIKRNRWKRIALQFPDDMLLDSVKVFQLLSRGLQQERKMGRLDFDHGERRDGRMAAERGLVKETEDLSMQSTLQEKLTILADTSYGACCVDEIAAEHVDAEVVIHYGRSCLSPTTRLPVVHVFTKNFLDLDKVVKSFKSLSFDLNAKIIVTADITYADHIESLARNLRDEGFNVFAATIQHNPSSPIPNRVVPSEVISSPHGLSEWQVFHISEPPTSLLLTLASRVANFYIYPTIESDVGAVKPVQASTALLLRRTVRIDHLSDYDRDMGHTCQYFVRQGLSVYGRSRARPDLQSR